jgi:hypothetical protein
MKTPMPSHPEPHTYTWTKLEEEAIRAAMVAAYNEAIAEAAKVCFELSSFYAVQASEGDTSGVSDHKEDAAIDCYESIRAMMKETP